MLPRALPAAVIALLFGFSSAAQAQVVKADEPGVTRPRLVKEVKPSYTAQAMRDKSEGRVSMTAVVKKDGSVGDVEVIRSLHPELDGEAVKSAKQWKFTPGRKDGQPVDVLVEIEMTFTLRDRKEDAIPADWQIDSPRVFKPGAGITNPVVIKETKPSYTEDAMRKRISGSVLLDVVVRPDGSVGYVRVARSLDPGLDAQAERAVRQWRFTPGMKDGEAVPVQVQIEMAFRLK